MRPEQIVRGAACVLVLAGTVGCYSLRSRLDPCGGRTLPAPPGGEVLPMNFAPEGEGFRIGLPPTKPVEGEGASGPGRRTYRWFILGHGQYEVTYAESDDLPTEPDAAAALFDRLKASALSKDQGRLEGERDLSLGVYAGRELVTRSDERILIRRFYVAGSRLYVLSAAVPAKLESCGDLESALKNLDTFELLEGGGAAGTPGVVK